MTRSRPSNPQPAVHGGDIGPISADGSAPLSGSPKAILVLLAFLLLLFLGLVVSSYL